MSIKKIFEKAFHFITEHQFRWWDLFIIIAYIAINGFMLTRHEPWSDEAFPWLVARDADFPTFLNIMAHNYDRHPSVMYLFLMPLAKAGLPYISQAIFNLVIAATAITVFMIFSPFSRLTKYLFVSSYYMMFEYCIITRPYTLAILIIFMIALLYPKRFKHSILYAILVIALCHTENLCFAVSAALAMIFGFEMIKNRDRNPWAITAFIIMSSGCLLAFMQGFFLPPDHMDYHVYRNIGFLNIFKASQKAFFPFGIPPFIFSQKNLTYILRGVSVIAIIAAFISLLKKPAALFLLFLSLAELYYIFIFIHVGDLRHYGFILISILLCFWISTYYTEINWFGKKIGQWVPASLQKTRSVTMIIMNVCFIFCLPFTYTAYKWDYYAPFSGSKQMAKNINELFEKHNLSQRGFVIVAKETSMSGLLPYMPDKKFWNPCTNTFLSYYLAKKQIADCCTLPKIQVIDRARLRFNDLTKVLFVFGSPLEIESMEGYKFKLVTAVDQKIFGYMYEKFYLYRAVPIE